MKFNLQDKRKLYWGAVAVILAILYLAAVLSRKEEDVPVQAVVGAEVVTNSAIARIVPEQTPKPTVNPEERIVTFFQGPKAWKKKKTYSGSWGNLLIDGGSFGGFGCGLCCMANIYTSLTDYRCSPLDMYAFAKKVSGYGGGGAIPWECMHRTLEKAGFSNQLEKKPSSYKEFQEIVSGAASVIALVSSYHDETYWKDTPGHYVTLFLYDEETDTVFLGDSGDLKRNRSRIPLKIVYKALKTSSPKQLLVVEEYKEEKNEWKSNRMTGKWVKKARVR